MKAMPWTVLLAAAALALAFLGWWLWPRLAPRTIEQPRPAQSTTLPKTCSDRTFEAVNYIVCEVNPAEYSIDLYLKGANGQPYQHLDKVTAEHPFLFSMNAGMYHEDFSPVGLFVADGQQLAPLNQGDAPGNFFMKPNGVFYVDQMGNAGVTETAAFAASGIVPRIATQSGPMLVIDGQLHPKFEPNGESRFVRNGVGVRDPHTVYFVISRVPVSLGSFARLFRDELRCPDALFFDGAVSALHNGESYVIGGEHPAGPIVAVSEKRAQ